MPDRKFTHHLHQTINHKLIILLPRLHNICMLCGWWHIFQILQEIDQPSDQGREKECIRHWRKKIYWILSWPKCLPTWLRDNQYLTDTYRLRYHQPVQPSSKHNNKTNAGTHKQDPPMWWHSPALLQALPLLSTIMRLNFIKKSTCPNIVYSTHHFTQYSKYLRAPHDDSVKNLVQYP